MIMMIGHLEHRHIDLMIDSALRGRMIPDRTIPRSCAKRVTEKLTTRPKCGGRWTRQRACDGSHPYLY